MLQDWHRLPREVLVAPDMAGWRRNLHGAPAELEAPWEQKFFYLKALFT